VGIVYCGPFADAIDEGTRYGHEGYAVQVLADGTESRSWVTEFREYRAACGCGWRGTGVYPPNDAGETSATEEWDSAHLQVLLYRVVDGKVVPASALLGLVSELRRELSAAVDARDVHAPMTERERGRCEVIEAVERRLDEAAIDAPPRRSGGPARSGGAW
jgi:hypothetical protein